MDQGTHDADRLDERIILVTGAAEGVGRAVALACAAHGATVVLSESSDSDLNDTYDRIAASGGPEPAILPLNLETAGEEDFLAAADVLGEAFGRLDGLVHCAAFAPFLSRIDDYDASEWERVLRINLTAPFLLTQVSMPLLRASEDASVIFTSDRVGRRGLAYWGAYAAAKFGIEGLMQVLAAETREGGRIRVNSIDPGVVRTALRARLYPGENPAANAPPESVTGAYLRLLGPRGRGISGKALEASDERPSRTGA
ncbi:MAG: SDR family NAD(P)-dependent oxidoreductase [Thiocapsa sp.]|nr:SDR family NAD(P)-dependent oxidoreductase [Thiocapsa sp.]MCG6896489.1 SDR family NAD(P)-dependent oxidoreductase [Thiocapsa sp.]MCG6985322.1 SDR family NAD(P)-dependent oxidoreductase [Thiocapsa sp.]